MAHGSLVGVAQRPFARAGRDEPPGTGMEPDCEFYLGERDWP